MATLQLHDQLLQFPLFLGMSRDDLNIVAGHTRLDFRKQPSQTVLIENGDPATALCFLLTGEVSVTSRADDGSYVLEEQLSAPVMLQPEVSFGYNQRYTHTFKTLTPVSLLTIDRAEVDKLSTEFLIFRINLLNLLATKVQKMQHRPWRRHPETLSQRIIRFVADRCIHPAGHKTLYILMKHLADELGDSRLDVSRALNALQREGLVSLHRGRIVIPQMERLLTVS